jgi:hypothetical protein
VDAIPAVAKPDDGATSTEQLAIAIPRRDALADAATVEFAPGFRKPPALGTPPPPPRPGDPLYESRLGRMVADTPRRRWRLLVPVFSVFVAVSAIGGLVLWLGGTRETTAAQAAPRALPEQIGTPAAAPDLPADSPAAPSITPTASPSTAVVVTTTVGTAPQTQSPVVESSAPPPPPPPPAPTLTGPAAMIWGGVFTFNANGFGCAGAQLEATLGGHTIPAGTLDGAGNGTIVVTVDADGMVGGPSGFPLTAGPWTVRAAVSEQAGCTAVSATATVTVTAS